MFGLNKVFESIKRSNSSFKLPGVRKIIFYYDHRPTGRGIEPELGVFTAVRMVHWHWH